jgi:hypothetical protein
LGCLAAAEAAAAAARACCANPTTHPAKDLALSQYLFATLNSPPDPKKLNKPLTPDNEGSHSMPQRHGAAQQPAWEADGMQLAGCGLPCRSEQYTNPTSTGHPAAVGRSVAGLMRWQLLQLALVPWLGAGSCSGSCQQAGDTLLSADYATLLWLARVEQQLRVIVFTADAHTGAADRDIQRGTGQALLSRSSVVRDVAASVQLRGAATGPIAARAWHQQRNSTAVATV